MSQKKSENIGNLILLGDASCGKKTLIQNLKNFANHKEENKKKNLQLKEASSYLIDYKYVKVKKQTVNDNFEKIGKMNVHLINKDLDYLHDFYKFEMLTNLVVVISLDLSKPLTVEEQYRKWKNYLDKKFKNILASLNKQDLDLILSEFIKTFEMIKNIKNLGFEEKQKNDEDVIQEESEVSEEEDGNNENKKNENNENNQTKKNFSLENFKYPLIIFGNKSSLFQQTDNENLLKFTITTLKKITKEEEAFLIIGDTKDNVNIEELLNLLIYICLKKDINKIPEFEIPENLKRNSEYAIKKAKSEKNLFIDKNLHLINDIKNKIKPNYLDSSIFLPFNLINIEKRYLDYKIEKKEEFVKKEISKTKEIKVIQTFYQNISKELFFYSENDLQNNKLKMIHNNGINDVIKSSK
jgi:hypothetical protein